MYNDHAGTSPEDEGKNVFSVGIIGMKREGDQYARERHG